MMRRMMMAAVACAALLAGKAQAEGHLVLYSANDDTVNGIVADAFQKATGTKVDVVSTGSGVLFRRIASEAANPQADVVWGVSAALLTQNKTYLQPYAAKGREAVPAQYRDPGDAWIGTNLQVLTLSQNTKSIPEGGPKSWEDLLDPKWKDKIAFTDPANSGSAYITATLLLQHWGGDDAAWDKLGKLLANTKVLNRSTLVFDGNGTGEYPLGISLEYAGRLWASHGAPLQVIYPSDGTAALAEGAAVVKNAPDADAARAFVDFLAGKEIQTVLLHTTFRRPARDDIDLGEMPKLSALKLIPYDDAKWDAARRDTLARLKTTIQQTR